MVDFVYICRSGDNEELRYSIRSVARLFPEARVWVVGGKPSWYKGNHIEVEQNQDKYTNALNNIIAICNSKEISDSFIFMNDDFFILKSFDLNETFHGGFLIDKINRYKTITRSSKYITKLESTYRMLSQQGVEGILDYELHVPIRLEKAKLESIVREHPTFLWRSTYGNLFKVGGTQIKDVKVYADPMYTSRSSNITNDSIFISTQDQSFKQLLDSTLRNILSKPSSLEA
jgi:hypothetical protein